MVAARPYSHFSLVRCSVYLGVIWGLATALSGCKKAEEIRTYTVAHRETPQLPKLSKQRILGAIIPNAQEAWFFKLQGPDEAVAQLEPDFIAFTKTVRVKDGKVTWKAPEKWQEKAGGEFRFTTFLIPSGEGKKPFELAISRLDAPSGVNDQYLVANLSRWRGQVGLDPITADAIPAATTKVDFDGGSAWLVSFTGLANPSGAMQPPFMNRPPPDHPPLDSRPGESAPAEANNSTEKPGTTTADFEFTTPKGWVPGKQSSMRKASLAVVEGDVTADISVFAFPADANDLLSNVNRWRDQVGLKPVTLEELEKSATKIEVSGHTGDFVELIGKQDAILGVMVKKGPSAWFFKLVAPSILAGRERSKFIEFVKSSRLP